MSMHFSDELVYSKSVSAHGNYKYLRITPIGSSAQNPTLSLSSTTMTQFELPNNVVNLSKCKLCFDINLGYPGATTHFNNLYANALSLIYRITLTSRSGTILADIPNCHIFGNLVSSVNTKLSDLMARSPPLKTTLAPGVALAGGYTVAQLAASTAASLLVSQANAVGDIVRCNGAINMQLSAATIVAPNVYPAVPYTPNTEPLNIYTGETDTGCSCQSYQIDLSAFKDTLMELNKNLYFGDNLVLTINWNSATKFAFTSAAVLASAVVPVALPTAPALSNLFLYTACETDPTIISQLVANVNSGEFSIITPFVYCQKYGAGASTSSSMQQRLNSSYGATLLRTYFGVFHNTETEGTAYNHNDGFITSYNTYMDGLRLQDFTLQPSDSTHWLYNERNFKHSCLQSLQQYKSNFIHIDNWCGAPPCDNDDSVLNGLSLDSDRTWSVQVITPSAALKYYLFFTTQKRLVISKGVLSIV